MHIDNKTSAVMILWLIIVASMIASLLILSCLLFRLYYLITLAFVGAILFVLIIRLFTIKYFHLEISEQLITITYAHPLLKGYKSATLELPLQKINFCYIDKGYFFNYLCIGVLRRKGEKVFHYNLGFLSKSRINYIEEYLKNVILQDHSHRINP